MNTRAMMEGTKAGVDKQTKRQRTDLLTFDANDYALMSFRAMSRAGFPKTGEYQ